MVDMEMDDADDIVASAFFDLLSTEGLDFLWEVVGDLIDSGAVSEVPSEEAPDEEKQAWVNENMPKVREAFLEVLGYDGSEQDEEE